MGLGFIPGGDTAANEEECQWYFGAGWMSYLDLKGTDIFC